MKKSHRVAHENQRRGGFCYNHYTPRGVNVKYYLILRFINTKKQKVHLELSAFNHLIIMEDLLLFPSCI